MLGVGNPVTSPTPLLGIESGVAFLNAQRPGNLAYPPGDGKLFSQHPPLAKLGPPYVYNVDLQRPETVVEAAYNAVRKRFATYIPWKNRREAVKSRVCSTVL